MDILHHQNQANYIKLWVQYGQHISYTFICYLVIILCIRIRCSMSRYYINWCRVSSIFSPPFLGILCRRYICCVSEGNRKQPWLASQGICVTCFSCTAGCPENDDYACTSPSLTLLPWFLVQPFSRIFFIWESCGGCVQGKKMKKVWDILRL